MSTKKAFRFAYSISLAALLAGVAACGGATDTATEGTDPAAESTDSGSEISGDIQVDGSSTVFPISEAMAEEFMVENPDTRVTVGVSGSGGGFEKFCNGETDISNASRPIAEDEIAACEEAGIEFIELPIAFDGITVVVNNDNDWAQCLTPDELSTMWAPASEGEVTNWNQVKSDYPDQPLGLYGPGTDSGTFDYFTDAINGEEGASRGDYTASEDDNVVVQGVESDTGGLGYFGYAYYEENQGALKALEIENADGTCVAPSREVIADGSYNPLSRPLFFYVKVASYEEKPQVAAFVDFLIDPANADYVAETGYVGLPDDITELVAARLENRTTGSIYGGGSSVGVELSDQL
ncbi:phosphate-binding protein [filamentous cyanobacterium CCP5]|nr:phosphate-binding protein [filamentous cyanobacterium CCP5]